MNLKENIGNASHDNHVFLHIFVDQNLGETVLDVMEKLELQKYYFLDGRPKSNVGTMYVYQKSIR